MINFIKKLFNHYRTVKEINEHVKQSPYKETLYSADWLIQHHDHLMDSLPEVWTHIDNIDYVQFGLKMRLLNVPWKNKDSLKEIIEYLEGLKMVKIKDNFQVIRNLDNKFNAQFSGNSVSR